ncbi:MAG: flavodoxin family protein [Proteobacteria bacterium]|nr:MAG: flavodoxin family protein [Pseudomonadota bacterium]
MRNRTSYFAGLLFAGGLGLVVAVFVFATSNLCAAEKGKPMEPTSAKQKLVFINASKNRGGNTASLGKKAFAGRQFKTINLVDYRIDQVGQQSKVDQYKNVIDEIAHADVIIIGTPVYWSDMSGYLKTFIDRLSDVMDVKLDSDDAPLKGAKVFVIIQGTEPSDAIPGITTVIKHICERFFMSYEGLILNSSDAASANRKLFK